MRGLVARDQARTLDPLGKSSILKSVLLGHPSFRRPTCLRLKPFIMDHNKTVRMRMDSPTTSEENQPTDQTIQARSESINEQGELPPAPSFYELDINNDLMSFDRLNEKFTDDMHLPYLFGEYKLLEKIGSGGAGIVYRAKQLQGEQEVALKILRPNMVNSAAVLQRFLKESRVHAQIKNPFVAHHLRFGQFENRYFLASEFINGENAAKLIDAFAQISNLQLVKKLSLLVIRDLLRGLSSLHQRGLIHRDIKPENAMVVWNDQRKTEISVDNYRLTKLIDFGLARPVKQRESLAITQQNIMLGTPLYMAPEQFSESSKVDARADIYSVGVTLYQMLCQQVPFKSNDAAELADKHRFEEPIPLANQNSGIGDALSNVVAKAMAKQPGLRYSNATEMLADIECLIDSRPIRIGNSLVYPEVSHERARNYQYQWTLDATVDQLWPLVSDTNRFNQAIGLPTPSFTVDHSNGERKIFAEARFNGIKVRWQEFPFQWVRLRELSVLRVFQSGPFESVTSTVKLAPLRDGKTSVVHQFQVTPRGFIGKILTSIQFQFATPRSLDRVYRRLESIAGQVENRFACDMPFGKPINLSKRKLKTLESRLDGIAARFDPHLVERFSSAIGTISDAIAGRLQPIRLARQLGCSSDAALELCCLAVEAGILQLTWDVICPICQVTAQNENSLKNIRQHVHCDYCNLDFNLDFANSIELIFKIHPDIRKLSTGKYCIGGPFHAPHVIAQNRVLSGTRKEFVTPLLSGSYLLKSSGHEDAIRFQTSSNATNDQLSVNLGRIQQQAERLRCATDQYSDQNTCIKIDNPTNVDIWSRLENETDREDSLTAASASMHPLFAEMFPSELIRPDQLIEKSNLYLLCIQMLSFDSALEQIGEVAIRENWLILKDAFNNNPVEINPQCVIGDTSAVFSFQSLATMLKAIERYCFAYPMEATVERNQYGLAIGFGEVLSSERSNQAEFFGPAIREIQKRSTQLLAHADLYEPMLLPNELGEIATLQPISSVMREIHTVAVDGHRVFQVNESS